MLNNDFDLYSIDSFSKQKSKHFITNILKNIISKINALSSIMFHA